MRRAGSTNATAGDGPAAGTRGYLVIGAESTGTRMIAQLLVAAGCRMANILGGDDGPERPLEGRRPVVRRSAPHRVPETGVPQWPDVPALVDSMGVDDPVAVVSTRDWFATMASQVKRGHVKDDDAARTNLRRAYVEILRGLDVADIPYLVSSYEAFVARSAYRSRLLAALELDDVPFDVYDGNDAHYVDERSPAREPNGG